ncbi:MAG: alpha/beta hydrolase [Bacteroidota bacterium]|nr:alpha/beta hydrolase [Bacteroidota bacterium]
MPLLYNYPEKIISLDQGIKINYCDEGSGECCLLFVHGLANYFPVWNSNIEFFKKFYRTIALDLPGNGKSSINGNSQYNISFYTDCVRQFIEKLSLKNVVLIGHSMGAQIVTNLAIRNTIQIKKLILCSPSGIERFEEWEKVLLKNALFLGNQWNADETYISTIIQKSFFQSLLEAAKIISDLTKLMQTRNRSSYQKMIHESILAMLNEPIYLKLKQIECPCLLLIGAKDQMIPNSWLHPMLTPDKIGSWASVEIKDCEYHLIQDCGHFIQIEQSLRFNQILQHFIRDL